MNRAPIINVKAATGRQSLIGAAAGKVAAGQLSAAAEALPPSPWVAVDFEGVDVISASAAREAVLLELNRILRARGTLPVYVNLNEESLDELEFAARAMQQPLVVAGSFVSGRPTNLTIVGSIDAKQLETLGVVAKLGEADAKSAHEAAPPNVETGVTAWNNRLANLAAMRLLTERKVGKTKYYSLPLEGLVDGN